MPGSTLGAMLRITENCIKADCLQDLERSASSNGPCGERDLRQVQEFFDTAKTDFTSRILAGAEVRPVQLGAGKNNTVALILQTFRWTPDYDIRNPTHPYNAAWKVFATWCADNDLAPVLRKYHDAKGKEHWYELSVRSALESPANG
ncbi:MAG TPA: hypothetical protein VGN46_04465 [Luteibacter sp.]|jgi:hypothetical protein|uniref:hypothetical protein n=1 Tax=Luteibacter sp. TaxID=1886636 RepID=UPI002F417B0C